MDFILSDQYHVAVSVSFLIIYNAAHSLTHPHAWYKSDLVTSLGVISHTTFSSIYNSCASQTVTQVVKQDWIWGNGTFIGWMCRSSHEAWFHLIGCKNCQTNWCQYEVSCMLVSGYHYMMLRLVCSVLMVQLGSLGVFVFNTIHSHIYWYEFWMPVWLQENTCLLLAKGSSLVGCDSVSGVYKGVLVSP